ncbi:MAG TPA: bifunctional glutamate N-acetyltransferase/amino-acid acetyltransferase ArgJ [Candidatus Saccharimonadales bacterium]|nr:bifunctional glutamate N-acetyltransferase/amino-acid acetyltransferase ArgJ [Candidatus Saccharimonadales bacterium]
MNLHGPDEPVFLPLGFSWSATKAGIKASGRSDVALAEAPLGASAAVMFTKNRVAAAPVEVGRAHMRRNKGRVRAVLVNAGNANCATGTAGLAVAEQSCAALGAALEVAPEFIIPSSTGIIGVPLPVEKLVGAVPAVVEGRGSDEDALKAFATAIMTTDTRMKLASTEFQAGKKIVRIAGICKGSGMIHPNMATMLVYIFTDLDAEPKELQTALKTAVDTTFNAISVDGDTSTNDTVLLLASGASKVNLAGSGVAKKFAEALRAVCASLAEQVVRDGEGAKHLVRLQINGAKSLDEARTIARSIANSPLVKTAWAGCDPNWGRILSSVGKSGIAVDPAKINIFFGPQQVCKQGSAYAFDEKQAHEYLKQPEYEIKVELGRGKSSLEFLTCDLTVEYVHINADYST